MLKPELGIILDNGLAMAAEIFVKQRKIEFLYNLNMRF